jgi:hypothetical protein
MSAAAIPMALREMAEHGLHLFPCHAAPQGRCDCGAENCPSPGKHPWLKHWQTVATTDLEQLARWLLRYPRCNWGIATGAISGVCVLDIDPRNGGDETLAAREAVYGPLPLSWECRTGGGGRHVFFRLPGADEVKSKNDALGKGLDFKAAGGLVIAAFSIHANGRPYAWDVDHHPDELALADIPPWILTALERHTPTGKRAVTADQWRERVEGEIFPGTRTQRITEVCGLLLRKNLEPHLILALLLGWNSRSFKPPLDEAKVTETVAGLMRREAKRREDRDAA